MNVRIFLVCAMECLCAHTKPRFIISSGFQGMECEPMLTARKKSSPPEPQRRVEPWHCIIRTTSQTHCWLSYFQPHTQAISKQDIDTHLGQVLHCFSLASASRTCRWATQVQVHGTCQCQVTPVCKRCDDQAWGAAQVLIPILESCIGLQHLAVVGRFIPFIPQLSAFTSKGKLRWWKLTILPVLIYQLLIKLLCKQ